MMTSMIYFQLTIHSFVIWLLSSFLFVNSSSNKPNILFILVDDLGWNDISFHNGEMKCGYVTPNIDDLALNHGLILNNYYVQSLCTPTRAALMTGRYPIKTGMQHDVLSPNDPYGLPLNYTLFSQDLQMKAGYNTYLFGKWHLGYFNQEYTPISRGFDTFYGFYNGEESFFDHAVTVNYNGINYTRYDLIENTNPVSLNDSMLQTYSTDIYVQKALDVLTTYNNSNDTNKKPLFIYLSLQNVGSPLEAPAEKIKDIRDNTFILSSNHKRILKAAKATIVDDGIGNIVKLLRDTGIWNNTLIIFSTDNGASFEDSGSNYPLRGFKSTLWEGGIRGTAFISGGYVSNSRRGNITNEAMHVTDWYPTLMDIVNITATDNDQLDGKSFFNIIHDSNAKSLRNETLLNIDPISCSNSYNICGGIKMGDWKLVIGNQVTKLTPVDHENPDKICVSGWCSNVDTDYYQLSIHNDPEMVECTVDKDTRHWNISNIADKCPFNGEACLYNIQNDPCEFHDVKANHSEIFQQLLDRLMYWKNQSVEPWKSLTSPIDPSNMRSESVFWIPWSITITSEIVTTPTSPIPTSNPTTSQNIPITISPTANPTANPTLNLTTNPTINPTLNPTINPTESEVTSNPTISTSDPTISPSVSPSTAPTLPPTLAPSHSPTHTPPPTNSPTVSPSNSPTHTPPPTPAPSAAPSHSPTHTPPPTTSPSIAPSVAPTLPPSNSPTHTAAPTDSPSVSPTSKPLMPTISEVASKGSNSYMTTFYVATIFSILGCGCLVCIIVCYKRSQGKNRMRHRRLEDTLKGIELRNVIPKPRSGGEYSGLLNI